LESRTASAAADVQHDLVELRDLHVVAVAELFLQAGRIAAL
jgi:hypothetical protein